ncbi:MAG: hypothetical protein ACI361_05055, partial [Atopobiaceae bacterium]
SGCRTERNDCCYLEFNSPIAQEQLALPMQVRKTRYEDMGKGLSRHASDAGAAGTILFQEGKLMGRVGCRVRQLG